MSASSAHDGLVPTTFGDLLRYLRRRAQLTQRDLGIAVGYSEAHINRFEKNKRLPDPTAVAALFVPVLDLKDHPELGQRLIELAHPQQPTATGAVETLPAMLEAIPPAPPFHAERVQALARLRERISAARHVVLAGLPGVGKTTLAATLAREFTPAIPVFWLTLTRDVTTFVDTLIYQLALFLVANGQKQVRALIQPTAVQAALPLDRRLSLLVMALNGQPALLCFDNAELIAGNEASLQVVRHLIATTSAYMLLMSRETLPLFGAAEVRLAGLERAEGMSLIACLSDERIDPPLAGRVLEKTGGNPMLVCLAVSQLVDERAHPALVEQLEADPQVTAFLLETVGKQSSPAEWQLLSFLAIFQNPVNLYDEYLLEQMQTVKETRGAATAITDLQRRHLIDHPTRAQLHPLIRDYVYRSLTADPVRRRRLHRLAADWYAERNGDAFAAAYHYAAAGLPGQTVDLIEENGPTFIERGQALSAAAVLDEAHKLIRRRRTGQNDLLRRLLTMRGILLSGTLRSAEGETNLREAIELTTSPAVRADIISRLAEVTILRSDFQETLRLVQAARAELAPQDLLLRARLGALESAVYSSIGKLDESADIANEVLSLTEQMASYPPSLVASIRARAQNCLAFYFHRRRRDYVATQHYAQEALQSARAAHQPRQVSTILNYIGIITAELGDLDASFNFRSQAVEAYLTNGDVSGAAYARIGLADVQHMKGQDHEALEKLYQAASTFRILNDLRGLSGVEEVRTYCLLWLGRIQEAREVIDQVLKEMEGKGTERLWGLRLNKLAIIQLVQGETEPAIATVRRAHDLPTVAIQPSIRFDLHSTLALALCVVGDHASAAQALADAPGYEGMSRWTQFERQLIEGYLALAQGHAQVAEQVADQVAQRAENCALFRKCAEQLKDAVRRAMRASAFPRLLWVRAAQ